MDTAKVFKNGRSQAVRIPQKYRFHAAEVSVRKEGKSLILTPIQREMTLEKFLSMPSFPDFEVNRTASQKTQERKLF